MPKCRRVRLTLRPCSRRHSNIWRRILAPHRHRHPLAVLFLDSDDLKSVIDNFGHEVGDLVLRRLCARWQPILRASDTLARAGGDEFVAILPETDEAGAARALQGLRRVAASPWVLRGNRIVVPVSIGVAVHPGDRAEADVLLKHADAVMYQEKRAKSGRGIRGRGEARRMGAVGGNAE